MGTKSLKNIAVSSLIWKLLDKFGTQIIAFVIQIILARLLLPSDYGLIAIVTIFISIANVFVHDGFNLALIQKKNADDLDFSSSFYLCFIVSIFLYFLIFIISPYIEVFYTYQSLSLVLRVLSLSLILNSFSTVQVAYVTKNFLFKKHFICNICSALISGIIAVIMAYNDFGIWSLVVYQLLNVILNGFFLVLVVRWYPKLMFSFARIKKLFSYGIKLLFSSLINIVFKNIYSLVIGKVYSSYDLGIYNRGNQFPSLISDNIDGSISTVLFPILSNEQEDKLRIKLIMKKIIQINAFLVIPILLGLIIVAEPLVKLLLTDKWIECVPFVQIMSLTYILYPIHTTNLQAINAIGHSDWFLKLEILKKIIVVISIIISIQYNIYVIAYFQIVISVISVYLNTFYSKKAFDYGICEQFCDFFRPLCIGIVMFVLVYPLNFLVSNIYLLLVLQVLLGAIVYILLSYFFNKKTFMYLWKIIIDFKEKVFLKTKRGVK